jgi:chaperonin cofactor prefoldin
MAEQGTIRADQIEGLSDLIREQVREVFREEVKSVPEDMDQLRRSPAGTMIRLEEQVKALDKKVDQRFEVLKSEMSQRFEVVDQRFEVVDQKFDALKSEINQRFNDVDRRFVDLKSDMDRRFNLLQWVVILNRV